MHSFWFWSAMGFAVSVVIASFFEWTLHRFFMHRPFGKFVYPFRAHALIHHHVFKADETYHLKREEDKPIIAMAWWNGPVLITLCFLIVLPIAWLTGKWGLAAGAMPAFIGYYSAYEYLHWCMHLPKQRRLEYSPIFRRLNGHHLLHHRYQHKNFNTVLPLADICLGTLMLRSKIAFPQARGSSVPDVQPKVKHPAPETVSA